MKNKTTNFYLKHSIIYYGFEVLRWITIIMPFVILIIINKDKWFKSVDMPQQTTNKLATGMIILIGVLAWTLIRELKKKKGRSYAPSVISGVVWWGIAFALSYCFKIIINDLSTIILYGLIGQVCGAFFEMLAQYQHEKRKMYQSAEINAKVFKKVNEPKKEIVPYE